MTVTLEQYINGMEDALNINPPCKAPAYKTDPEWVWRYYMRTFGCGLAYYDEKEVKKHVGEWYGRWFVRHETFAHNRVKVNAKEFNEWVLGAMREEQARRASRQAIVNKAT